MKRGKGTKHHTRAGDTDYPLLVAARELVSECVSTGEAQERLFAVQALAGTVKLTIRAEIADPKPALIVRPS